MNYDCSPDHARALLARFTGNPFIVARDEESSSDDVVSSQTPSFHDMMDRIEQVVTADTVMREIFTARFASMFADVKAKPNLADYPMDFSTLEVSIFDNQPLGKWTKVKESSRKPVRFTASVKASVKTNRRPLDRPDWIANVCELRSPETFGKMVRQRWKLTGNERIIADQLALMEGVLIGRMKMALKGRGQGGEHFYPNHFIVVREDDLMKRDLAGAIIMTPTGNVRVGQFSPTLAGGDPFQIYDRPGGNKSAVIVQSRHSTRPSLTDWISGVSGIVEQPTNR